MGDYLAGSKRGRRSGRGRSYGRGFRGGEGRGRGWRRGRHFARPQRQRDFPQFGDDQNDIEEIGVASPGSLSIAVEGCCHGELDRIYERLQAHEKGSGRKIDLLLCCGDFESFRNAADFHSSCVPPKYRKLGTFPKYFSGEKKAPILTVFIGGNHEASQPLRELYYGGWVAPNIYYLGAAGVVRFGGLRIGGISGIYKSHDYTRGHHERPPYDPSSLRSVYHVRNVDVYRLKCLSKDRESRDIMISHDWPLGVEQFGDTDDLLRRKPWFRADVQQNALGSPPNREILDVVQPRWWFSAHLHVKFKASVRHRVRQSNEALASPLALIPSQTIFCETGGRNVRDEAKEAQEERLSESKHTSVDPAKVRALSAEGSGDVNQSTEFLSVEGSNGCIGPDLTDQMTRFLALDKCLPRRQYLSILNIPCGNSSSEPELEYDVEWLAILRKTHHLTSTSRANVEVPSELVVISANELDWVKSRLDGRGEGSGSRIPSNFVPTVPLYSDSLFSERTTPMPMMGNPQTDELLQLLDLSHIITIPYEADGIERVSRSGTLEDENEIDIEEGNGDSTKVENGSETQDVDSDTATKMSATRGNEDENEIDLDVDDDGVTNSVAAPSADGGVEVRQDYAYTDASKDSAASSMEVQCDVEIVGDERTAASVEGSAKKARTT